MKTPIFDRNALKIKPLVERAHDLDISAVRELDDETSFVDKGLSAVADRIVGAVRSRSAVALMMGAHVIRSGVQRHIIDMLEKGYVSCVSLNGGGMIHDFEFSLAGATTESVARYVSEGQFGLWTETGMINDIINEGYAQGLGMGEAVGRAISEGDFPHKEISLLAACYRLGIPATVHVGIGYDIIHEHPNCDGAATGGASYRDFLYFAKVLQALEGGVVMNFGSAVMAPEVFLKALSMARNVAHNKGGRIRHFTTLVCDILKLPEDFRKEPPKDDPAYYFRPLKTMLVRTVADGGESFYVRGRHLDTVRALRAAINRVKAESD